MDCFPVRQDCDMELHTWPGVGLSDFLTVPAGGA
jgi:hypothetical protein